MNKVFLGCLISFLLQSLMVSSQPKYEFRGVWVATVNNIDWPSNKYLSSDSQRAEFVHLLDMHKRNGMNAIIVQIRPCADAFYPSPYEPWSEWLSGFQGNPPVPYYDPLAFMITETHKRGMEFHAWLNPYRAVFNIGYSSISPTHITRLHPEWFLTYGRQKIFDPGNKEVQKFVSNIVKDIVSRYDVDAIHLDDYFYPYRIAGHEFPDANSFAKYGKGMNKDDWRRSNVDSIIVLLSKTIKEANKYCRFGISPFGVWRNIDKDADGSNTKSGLSNYDDLYADILLWLKMKWIDYAAPQLYWEFGQRSVPFETIIDWWAKHSFGRHLYIGHGIYRAFERQSAAWRNKNEIPNQIKKVREYTDIQGSVFYSSKVFNRNPNGWNDSLRNNYYKYPALVPPMPWINNKKPLSPLITLDTTSGNILTDSIHVLIHHDTSENVTQFVIYSFSDTAHMDINSSKNILAIISSQENRFPIYLNTIPSERKMIIIGVTSVNKFHNESEISSYIILERKQNRWIMKTQLTKSQVQRLLFFPFQVITLL